MVLPTLISGAVTLILGFIVGWLVAWLMVVRSAGAPSSAAWRRVLVAAVALTAILVVLTLSPVAGLRLATDKATSQATALPLLTGYPTYTPYPTSTPYPTYTLAPTQTPYPTHTPAPTSVSKAMATPVPVTPTVASQATHRAQAPAITSTARASVSTVAPSPSITATSGSAVSSTTRLAQDSQAPAATPKSELPVTGVSAPPVWNALVIAALIGLLVGGGLLEVRRRT